MRIPVDLPRAERRPFLGEISDRFEIAGVTDGKTFESRRIRLGAESCVSVWVAGLPDGTPKAEISLRLEGADLPAVYVSIPDERGLKQINAMLPPNLAPGEYFLAVNVRGAESREVAVELFRQ